MPASRRHRLPARRRAVRVALGLGMSGLTAAAMASCSPTLPTATGPGLPPASRTPTTGLDGSAIDIPSTAAPPSPTGSTAGIGQDLPVVLVGLPIGDSGGVSWWTTAPGSLVPTLQLTTDPTADIQPAGRDGSILTTSGDEIVLARITSDGLTPIERIPADRAVLPACITGDGRPVVADAETLELLVAGEAGLSLLTDVPLTTGDCAPLPDGRTMVATDGGGLWVVAPDAAPRQIAGSAGRQLSAGGGRLARTDPTAEGGAAVVHQPTIGPDGRLGPEIGRVVGAGHRTVTRGSLSADGAWLGVTLVVTHGDERTGRVRLYRVSETGLVEIADEPSALGTRLVVLPAP